VRESTVWAVLFAIVDESSNHRHYRTVGLIVSARNLRPLTLALDGIALAASSTFEGIEPIVELHGHDLFAGTEDWQPLKQQVRARIGIYAKALRAIVENSQTVFVEKVNRSAFRKHFAGAQDEHVVSLIRLLKQIDNYADQLDEDIVVIADEHHTARLAQRELQRISHKRMVDTVFFVPSDMSRLVQAVDLVAFLHQRVSDTVERDPRAARTNESLWRLLEPIWDTSHEGTWRPEMHDSPRR